MKCPLDPAIHSGTHKHEKTAAPFLGWKQLPAKYQRELITTLASVLIKRLASPAKELKEVGHEQAC